AMALARRIAAPADGQTGCGRDRRDVALSLGAAHALQHRGEAPDAVPRVRGVGGTSGRPQDRRAQHAVTLGHRASRSAPRRRPARGHARAGRLGQELGVLLHRADGVAGDPREARGRARAHDMVKALSYFKRRTGMPVEEFQAYWRSHHPDVVTKLPGVLRYVQSHTRATAYEKG